MTLLMEETSALPAIGRYLDNLEPADPSEHLPPGVRNDGKWWKSVCALEPLHAPLKPDAGEFNFLVRLWQIYPRGPSEYVMDYRSKQ